MTVFVPTHRAPRRRAQYALALTDDKPKARVVVEVPKEAEVQRAVLAVLALHPRVAFAHRINTRVVDVVDRKSKKGTRPMVTAPKGHPDIAGMLTDGTALYVECKRPGGALSEPQIEFLSRVNKHGGVGLCVDSVDTLLKYLPMPSDRGGLDIL